MAIKQRALMKLDMTKKHILHVMRTGSKTALDEVYRNLTESRDLYRKGLPRSGYATYGEIYDELILAVQKIMGGGEANFREEVLALCQELLEHLEKETAKETRFKKEIFFLPYKMSMFDSLESVWRAANKDKAHCIAYVMPIPYADRKPDQTVAEWHCERDQFPEDIPTLDWQQVNLKAWHPDIIVYHSPYDNCNAVTSVDEQYYSRNLRYCADKLVYIPYFVLAEPTDWTEEQEENIAHYITAPGVLNADLIVVQSEAMRQVYINVLSRHTNQGKEYWEEHISGAGSPKFDKVAASKREDFDLPESWQKILRGRKAILYNTGLTAMLEHTDVYCGKIRFVLETFKNREDVALWWRPHPLMKATFRSMRPELEAEYDAIVAKYREEGWGIYDDTAELERAIAWTDGYYGDASSVVELYKMTGKPVMLQNVTKRCNVKSLLVHYGRAVTDGKFLWYVTEEYPLLVKLDASECCIVQIFVLPVSPHYCTGYNGYRNVEKIGDTLYILPCSHSLACRGILTFQLATELFGMIEIPESLLGVAEGVEYENIFYGSNSDERYIYMLGYKMPIILQYDTWNKTFRKYEEWKHHIGRELDVWISEDSQLKDDILLMTICNTKLILELNVASGESVLHSPDGGVFDSGYISMMFDGKSYWFQETSQFKWVKWDKGNGNLCEYAMPSDKNTDKDWLYRGIFDVKDEVWSMPMNQRYGLILNSRTGCVEFNQALPSLPINELENCFHSNYPGTLCFWNDFVYMIQPDMEILVKVDRKKGAIKQRAISLKMEEDVPLKRMIGQAVSGLFRIGIFREMGLTDVCEMFVLYWRCHTADLDDARRYGGYHLGTRVYTDMLKRLG